MNSSNREDGRGERFQFDFFIAHASADIKAAERLYDLLIHRSRAFLDSRCLLYGDDWDIELALAQKRSCITVVLISSGTEPAYYLREEIAAAIAMAREDKLRHRVVPVYLDTIGTVSTDVPYGLRLKHGLHVPVSGQLDEVADRLLDLVHMLQERTAESVSVDNGSARETVELANSEPPGTPGGIVSSFVKPRCPSAPQWIVYPRPRRLRVPFGRFRIGAERIVIFDSSPFLVEIDETQLPRGVVCVSRDPAKQHFTFQFDRGRARSVVFNISAPKAENTTAFLSAYFSVKWPNIARSSDAFESTTQIRYGTPSSFSWRLTCSARCQTAGDG